LDLPDRGSPAAENAQSSPFKRSFSESTEVSRLSEE